MVRTSWLPLRVRPDLCLPADSLLPGHKPAHDARWAAVGKRDMSTPISEMITCAARSPIPGIVRRRLICWAKGARTRSIRVSSSSIMDVRWSMCSRCIRASSPWLIPEAARARHGQVGDLLAHHATGEVGEHTRVAFPADQRLDHVAGRECGDAG